MRTFFLSVFILLFISILPAFGQIPVGGCFKKISSITEMDETGNYLFLSVSPQKSALLTAAAFKGKKKLAATECQGEAVFTTPPLNCIWKIKKTHQNKYVLYSPVSDKVIDWGGSSATDVIMGTRAGESSQLSFDISQEKEGFRLSCQRDDQFRALSFDPVYDYFGLFVPSSGYYDFQIYKFQADTCYAFSDFSAEACAFVADGNALVVSESGECQLKDVSDFVLRDSTLARDADVSFFENKDLPVLGLEDGSWKLAGTIPVYETSKGIFGFCVSALNGSEVTLQDLRQVDVVWQKPFHVFPLSSPQHIKRLAGGFLQLLGGWSVPALSSVEINKELTALDLREAVLPFSMPLLSLNENPNALIYVSQTDNVCLSPGQNHVVLCGSSGNHLQGDLVLEDKYPFQPLLPFSVDEGQLTYKREVTDSGWQTLYLPFSIQSVPVGYSLYKYKGMQTDGILINATSDLDAYEPSCFRLESAREGIVVFKSKAQTIGLPPESSTSFVGSLSSVTTFPNNAYALSADGSSFVPIQSGSFLYPFRVYIIWVGDTSNSVKLINFADGIRKIPSSGSYQSVHLSGRAATGNDRCFQLFRRKLYLNNKK